MFGEFDKNCKFAAHRTSKINEFSQPKLLAPVGQHRILHCSFS